MVRFFSFPKVLLRLDIFAFILKQISVRTFCLKCDIIKSLKLFLSILDPVSRKAVYLHEQIQINKIIA